MNWVKRTRILDRDQAIDGLASIRQEWQEAANGTPLVEMRGSVGLLLADVASAMGLSPEEAAWVLGGESTTHPAQMRLVV